MKNTNQDQWNHIWAKKGIYNKILSCGRDFYNYFFKRLVLKYATGKDMVELGCGQISLALLISDKVKSYVGVDYSSEAISMANEIKPQNARLIEGDVFNLPDIGKFDLVWSQGLVEHYPDYKEIIKAHLNLTKPGGVVLISVPYLFSYHWLWFKLTRPKFLNFLYPWEATNVNFLTKKDLGEDVFFLPPALIGFILGIIILRIKKTQV